MIYKDKFRENVIYLKIIIFITKGVLLFFYFFNMVLAFLSHFRIYFNYFHKIEKNEFLDMFGKSILIFQLDKISI